MWARLPRGANRGKWWDMPVGHCQPHFGSKCSIGPPLCAGRNETNGRSTTKSLTAASEPRSPQPRIVAKRRNARMRRGTRGRRRRPRPRRGSAASARMSRLRSGSECRMCAQVPDPLGVRSPGRADDRLAGLGVVGQRHRDRLAALAGLSALVGDQQEGVAEQPAPATVVERARQPHRASARRPGCRRSPSSGLADARCARRGRHDFVTGGLKISRLVGVRDGGDVLGDVRDDRADRVRGREGRDRDQHVAGLGSAEPVLAVLGIAPGGKSR